MMLDQPWHVKNNREVQLQCELTWREFGVDKPMLPLETDWVDTVNAHSNSHLAPQADPIGAQPSVAHLIQNCIIRMTRSKRSMVTSRPALGARLV